MSKNGIDAQTARLIAEEAFRAELEKLTCSHCRVITHDIHVIVAQTRHNRPNRPDESKEFRYCKEHRPPYDIVVYTPGEGRRFFKLRSAQVELCRHGKEIQEVCHDCSTYGHG